MSCIFCDIANKTAPGYIVFEDAFSIAFLDIFPFVKGHTLVIPKKHCRWLWDMEDEEYMHLMQSAKTVASKLKKTYQTDYIQTIVLGEEVAHAHIHLLPRVKNDGYPVIPTSPITQPTREEMLRIQSTIKNSL